MKVYCAPYSDPEQIKTFQQWKKRTADLVLDLQDTGRLIQSAQHLTQLSQHYANAISEVIAPFMRSSADGHEDRLVRVIRQAVELDREISKQLPRITWAFSAGPVESPFDFSRDQ
ncbi:hypothetical protein diail_3835 [Diaporthe ilicicola]|nr:hypothetical protein diail_3835 [Diaporthe ilicicola]